MNHSSCTPSQASWLLFNTECGTDLTIQGLTTALQADSCHLKMPQTQPQSHSLTLAHTRTEQHYVESPLHCCHLKRYYGLRRGKMNIGGSDSWGCD